MACCFGSAEGNIAGAAGDIEQRERRIVARRVEGRDHDVLPDAMQSSRHQIVHQVVALCDAVKYAVHQRLLVVHGDVPEAEMCRLVGSVHAHLLHDRTIACHAALRYKRGRATTEAGHGLTPWLIRFSTIYMASHGITISENHAHSADVRYPQGEGNSTSISSASSSISSIVSSRICRSIWGYRWARWCCISANTMAMPPAPRL